MLCTCAYEIHSSNDHSRNLSATKIGLEVGGDKFKLISKNDFDNLLQNSECIEKTNLQFKQNLDENEMFYEKKEKEFNELNDDLSY